MINVFSKIKTVSDHSFSIKSPDTVFETIKVFHFCTYHEFESWTRFGTKIIFRNNNLKIFNNSEQNALS